MPHGFMITNEAALLVEWMARGIAVGFILFLCLMIDHYWSR